MRVRGQIRVPGDKSISHRALILAALADGTSRLRGLLDAGDIRSTSNVLRTLGVDLPRSTRDKVVRGRGLRGLRMPLSSLDCGNSGTTARLLAGVLAAYPYASRFVGDASLSRRPMRRLARALEAMGAKVELEALDGLPMTVKGGELRPLDWRTEVPSAQLKSALLLAGLASGVRVTVHEPTPSRDHTERMLRALGAPVTQLTGGVSIDPVTALVPLDLEVPGDPSSAAYFVALAALASDGSLVLPGVGMNDTRTGFLRIVERMGARVHVSDLSKRGGEEVGTIEVSPGTLRGTTIGALEVPSTIDELPLLACLAARAEGETVLTGAEELRLKESDRISTTVANLRALGVEAEELRDGFRVQGSEGGPLEGRVVTRGDHRIAMAFAVLGAATGAGIVLDDPACVSVSYPAFWDDLERATRGEAA